MDNQTTVFASQINNIEFDVTDPVTAKLLRANSKSEYVQEVDGNGNPIHNTTSKRGQATGGEIELDN